MISIIVMRQLNLFKVQSSSSFGGELGRGKRKSRRPLDVKNPIHLVLRADVTRSGSFLNYQNKIDKCIQKYANKFQVKIYQRAVVSNHLHFVIKVPHRLNYIYFIRALACTIAISLNIKWLLRPFTRIISWGRDFKNAIYYVMQNELEAMGVIAYKKRNCRPP